LGEIDDPVFRETIRDFAVNTRFRRDLFARGNVAITPVEHRRNLSTLSFALTVPRGRVSLKFAGPLFGMNGREEFYLPLLDALADRTTGFYELLQLPQFGLPKIGMLLEHMAALTF
jgi:Predicted methyltransferase regulatory domain